MNVLVNFAIMCVGISSVLWSKTGKVSIMFILCYIICNTFMLNMETKLLKLTPPFLTYCYYSHTCIERAPLGHRKSGLLG